MNHEPSLLRVLPSTAREPSDQVWVHRYLLAHPQRVEGDIACDREQPRQYAPRLGSYESACCQARSIDSCAISSAKAASPTIVIATPKTRAWNRRTKAAERSGSPDPKPASKDSSESDLTSPIRTCLLYTSPSPRD